MGSYSLTRRQKRLMVQGRLTEPDAQGLSDREIARELDVSQPFVSALRRGSQVLEAVPDEEESHVATEECLQPSFREEGIDSSPESSRGFLDTTPRASWVKRSSLQMDVGRALHNFDPFG